MFDGIGGVKSVNSGQMSQSSDDETKRGLLRLVDFLNKRNAEKEPEETPLIDLVRSETQLYGEKLEFSHDQENLRKKALAAYHKMLESTHHISNKGIYFNQNR